MNNLDLIRQYVNTGQPIGDYQLSKLPKNLLNSYLRKREQIANANNDPESNYRLTRLESLSFFVSPSVILSLPKDFLEIIKEGDTDKFIKFFVKNFDKLTPIEKKIAVVLTGHYGLFLPEDEIYHNQSLNKYTEEEIKSYVESYIRKHPNSIMELVDSYKLDVILPIIGKENLKRIPDYILREYLHNMIYGYNFNDDTYKYGQEIYKLLELYFGKDRIENIRKKYGF